jgi:hypothetical protein
MEKCVVDHHTLWEVATRDSHSRSKDRPGFRSEHGPVDGNTLLQWPPCLAKSSALVDIRTKISSGTMLL